MNTHRGYVLILMGWLLVSSCTIHKKDFDNPVDFKANEEKGIGAPTLVFYPITQTKSLADSIIVGAFIVFKEDSMKSFAGVHLQVVFPATFLEFDTVTPGVFITDTLKATPLFTYTFDGTNTVDIFTYFLDTLKTDLIGTGHLANIIFSATSTGNDSIRYNLNSCELIDHNDVVIDLKGDRGAEVIIQ